MINLFRCSLLSGAIIPGEKRRRGKTCHFTEIALACFLLSGCVAGPDFQPPAAPAVASYTAEPLPEATVAAPGTEGTAQRFLSGDEIPPLWWTLFKSEALDRLIRRALAHNSDYTAAEATLRQARELRRAQVAVLYPGIDANAGVSRQKYSSSSSGQSSAGTDVFTLFNTSVAVSYTLDSSGGVQRGLEALQAQIDYQRFQLEGAYLTITANVVTTAITEASLRARIQAFQDILTAQERQLKVVEQQLQMGAVSRSDVLAQRTQIARTRAALPPLEKELAQTRHLLALLCGTFPHEASNLPEFDLAGLVLPQELPVSLPSSLVRQRPDIRAAEELLHAASAQIGVATANLYPRITLTGSYGFEANKLSDLFATGASNFNLGAGLLQPLFHGGELKARQRAAQAAYDQARARYQSTVLQAFLNVADVLRALNDDARTLKAQAEAEQAARDSLDLTRDQFRLGAVSYLTLLNAEQQYQQVRVSLAQAQAARFADTAGLFQALGGGWWNRAEQRSNESETVSD